MSQNDRTYTRNLVAFAEALREHGVSVSTDDVIGSARALARIDPLDRSQFYHGLKANVIDEPAQESVFDDLFVEYWDELSADLFEEESPPGVGVPDVDERVAKERRSSNETKERIAAEPPETPDSRNDPAESGDDVLEFSEKRSDDRPGNRSGQESEDAALEIGRHEHSTQPSVSFKDDQFTSKELELLVTELGRQLGTLRGFRRRIQPSGTVDLRRSLDVVREQNPNNFPRVEKERSQAKARFFVDVSHSMLRNMHQEFLLFFLFECMRQFADVRIFLFDTDATEVTRYFESANITGTLREMQRAQTEWGAGTTIGACLEEILTEDPFVVDRDTISVVISDGWDAGEDAVLRDQIQALGRRCLSLLWFNPRATSPNYEPKVSGMNIACKYVDHHFGFRNLENLRTIVEQLRSRANTTR